MLDVTWVDLVMILILSAFCLHGFIRGFFQQVSALAGLFLGVYLALLFGEEGGLFLAEQFPLSPVPAQIISFIGIVVIVALSVRYLGRFLRFLFRLLSLSVLDRLAGGLFGIFKGGLLIYLLIFLATKLPYPDIQVFLDSSFLAHDILALSPYLQESMESFLALF